MNCLLIYVLPFVYLLASCSEGKKDKNQAGLTPVIDCLIARKTVKELVTVGQPSQLDIETLTSNGDAFKVGTTQKSVYTYDKQGRILIEYNQYAGSQANYHRAKADSVFYQYNSMSVLIRTVKFSDSTKEEITNEVKLDSQGFAEKQPTNNLATYNKDGYLTTLRDEYGRNIAKIEDGNVLELKFSDSPANPSYITKSEYNLTKPGLPSIRSFYGKISRNLLIKETIDANYFDVNTFPSVYITTYTYTFDSAGRIVRQIDQGKNGEVPYIYGGNSIKVIDFIYTCSQ